MGNRGNGEIPLIMRNPLQLASISQPQSSYSHLTLLFDDLCFTFCHVTALTPPKAGCVTSP